MDSKEYEMVRNMTLLFFFEKLMDKGGPRTLHDLSCQFGAKGFTKEMRQIAGGSQSGLKKFLTQYPSLFTVDGEHVYASFSLPENNEDETSGSNKSLNVHKRDYVNEAVEYFSNKLKQYGEGTEVPIKSLLGHRSQASPEVRHISGQHLKDFRDFLLRYPETFCVIEDNVILAEYIDSERQPFKELEETEIDPQVTGKLLSFCKDLLRSRGPLLVDQLFHCISDQLPEEMWFSVCKTAADLSTFLKMYSDVFDIKSNLVSLTLNLAEKPPCAKPLSVTVAVEEKTPKYANGQAAYIPLSPPEDSPKVQQTNNRPQSLKQRINSLLMKALAENTEKDRSFVTSMNNSNVAVSTSAHNVSNNNTNNGSNGVSSNGESWKAKLLQSSKIIVNPRECTLIIEDIFKQENPVVSFDCEGINIGVKGQITLFQICTTKENVYVFDIVTCPLLINNGGLQRLLESENILKVMHDCRNISVNLYNQFGITLRNIFDTQAAHALLHFQETGKPVYKTKNISLSSLCESYSVPVSLTKDQLKYLCHRDYKFWARRPLSRDMLLCAAADVAALVPYIYNIMRRQISSDLEFLLWELSEEQVYMYIRPDEVKQRKKQRKIENELADLQTKLAAVSNSSRNIVLSNREIRLLRYLDLTEEEKEKLKGSYKVAKKLEKLESKSKDTEEGDGEFQSLESCVSEKSTASDNSLPGVLSPTFSSEPPSITESMQMVDEILSDTKLDRLDRIEKLEEVLNSVIARHENTSSNNNNNTYCCNCHCHNETSTVNHKSVSVSTTEADCQTLSTGDIVITNVFYEENPKCQEKTLIASARK
ncbi:egalitarian protein homolog [Planococcus citri]|uniref:egalitarian protein homolog n=1 Tax=Planococcus citri TaxID=170843 RepID=UPI0031F75E53